MYSHSTNNLYSYDSCSPPPPPLTTGSDLESFNSCFAVDFIITTPQWLHVTVYSALTWASDHFCQNFTPHSLFSSFPVFSFSFLTGCVNVCVLVESLSFQCGAVFACNSKSDLLPTQDSVGSVFCTYSVLKKLSLHYYH